MVQAGRLDAVRAAILVLGFVLGGHGPASAGIDDAAAAEHFESKVRPLLIERCGECHGETGKAKGGLRLTSRDALLKGGEGGPAVVPGKADESAIVQAIRYTEDPKMPPSGKLSDAEIAAITRWVESGAPWPASAKAPLLAVANAGPTFTISEEQRRFWSFQPVKDVATPPVRDAAWPRRKLDHFILAALEARELKPAPEADRGTFIRRATYDLTGLPPTPEDVAAFADDWRPDAHERLIDRLLASPAYGERWGRHWLDLVRYTDSFDARIAGSNNEMDINDSWRYRDWVVRSLNRDLPYDQFLVQQIAGDLLAGAKPGAFDPDPLVATGVLALGNWGGGDADKEKLLTDIADDQVDLVSRAFLGLTVACARCHDHKFDPISTKDYYGLAGIFFSTHILPNVGPKTNGPPMLKILLESPAQRELAGRRAKRLKEIDRDLKAKGEQGRTELARSLRSETASYILAAWESAGPGLRHASAGSSAGLKPFAVRRWSEALGFADRSRRLDRPIRDALGKPGVLGWRGEADTPSVLVNTTRSPVPILTFTLPARSVAMHPGPTSGVSATWTSPITGPVRVTGRLADADPSGGDGVSWTLERVSNGVPTLIASGDLPNGDSRDLRGGRPPEALDAIEVETGGRIRLTVRPKMSHVCDNTAVNLSIEANSGTQRWDVFEDLITDPLAGNPHADQSGRPGVWRFDESGDPASMPGRDPAEARAWEELAKALRAPEGNRASARAAAEAFAGSFQKIDASSPFYPSEADGDAVLPPSIREELARLGTERDGLVRNPLPPPEFANGAQEGGVPGSAHAGVHDVRVHVRGTYSRLGDLVPRHFPVVLAGETQPPVTPDTSGRLDLARWITRPDHPLTARVMANRVWQHHFGAGIVRTPGNFGKLGERPTHPELLDHLALRFVSGGWSLKTLHREIMLSSTYRQSVEADPATFRADPDNRLFGRTDRRRLDAESVRDSLLAVSGQLDLKAGGPSTRDRASRTRSLYQMTIRSDRSSFSALFDAADPTAIVDTRVVSTVAPQALYLLNNGFVLAQANALAKRLLAEQPDDAGAQVERAYALLFGRAPDAAEKALAADAIARFSSRGGPQKAWAAYCHVLFCTNEWIYTD